MDERRLRELFAQDVPVPNSFANAIRDFPRTGGRGGKTVKWSRILPAAAAIAVLGASLVFAGAAVRNFFFPENGILNAALNYDYVQNVETEPLRFDGAGVRIESVMMDDSSLYLVFDCSLDSKPENFSAADLPGLRVEDEQGRVFFEEGNPEAFSTGFASQTAADSNGAVKLALFLTNSRGDYPKSEKLLVRFPKVRLSNGSGTVKEYRGEWAFELGLSELFSQREEVLYRASENPDVTVTSARLTQLAFYLELQFDAPFNAEELLGGNMRLTDENGKEYPITGSLQLENEAAEPTVRASFAMTGSPPGGKLLLTLRTEKEITIELEKSG